MIREARPEERTEIMQFLSSLSMFGESEMEEITATLDAFLYGTTSHESWLVDEDRSMIDGIAYFAPEAMTHGTWNLYFIGVRAESRKRGIGTRLVQHIEQTLQQRGARVLLVETSGTETYADTQDFYLRCGFEREARIRDFYKAGDDKIIFRKALTS